MNGVEEQVETEVIVTTTRPEPVSRTKRQPRYAVVVLNDDVHTFDYVISGFTKVFGYSEMKAFLLAVEIHTKGRSIVWTGPLEVAELKRDQIRGLGPDVHASTECTFPLGVELEPID